jgi:hypothetical protein
MWNLPNIKPECDRLTLWHGVIVKFKESDHLWASFSSVISYIYHLVKLSPFNHNCVANLSKAFFLVKISAAHEPVKMLTVKISLFQLFALSLVLLFLVEPLILFI